MVEPPDVEDEPPVVDEDEVPGVPAAGAPADPVELGAVEPLADPEPVMLPLPEVEPLAPGMLLELLPGRCMLPLEDEVPPLIEPLGLGDDELLMPDEPEVDGEEPLTPDELEGGDELLMPDELELEGDDELLMPDELELEGDDELLMPDEPDGDGELLVLDEPDGDGELLVLDEPDGDGELLVLEEPEAAGVPTVRRLSLLEQAARAMTAVPTRRVVILFIQLSSTLLPPGACRRTGLKQRRRGFAQREVSGLNLRVRTAPLLLNRKSRALDFRPQVENHPGRTRVP